MAVNGPQHFAEAERLLALAEDHQTKLNIPTAVAFCHRAAQVHATLALAAATATTFLGEFIEIEDTVVEWARVTG